jgi:two-component system chemotaxis response regulator CheY
MRVLIIDDSAVMRKIVEDALRHAGLDIAEVLQAANGAQGLAAIDTEAARGQPIHLILCDVHMPVIDGAGFMREITIRNLAPGVPVVMITADSADPFLTRAVAAGARGYIAKPFTLLQVRIALASLGIGPDRCHVQDSGRYPDPTPDPIPDPLPETERMTVGALQ